MLKKIAAAASHAVLGSQIERDYDIGSQIGSGGPGYLWRMHTCTHKASGHVYTAFVFDKRHVERFAKHEQAQIIDVLRKGCMTLARLRHPRILEIHQPLVETATSLVLVTEAVMCSLGNALGIYENLRTLPLALKELETADLNKQIGLLQLTEALAFCHRSAKLIHGNVSPEEVFMDSNGDWRLGGFHFSLHTAYTQPDNALAHYSEFESKIAAYTQPNLDFAAPERVLNDGRGGGNPVDTPSDMWSLGMLMYALWNHGRGPYDNKRSLLDYKHNVGQVPTNQLDPLPPPLRRLTHRLLSLDAGARPGPDDVRHDQYFNETALLTVLYLQALVEKEELEKAEFFRGLAPLLDSIPPRMLKTKIIGHLIDELANPLQVAFVLPNIFVIADKLSKAEFRDLVLAGLVRQKVFAVQDPPQVMSMLIARLDYFLDHCPEDITTAHVLPVLFRALDSGSVGVQEEALAAVPRVSLRMNYSTFKNSLFPRICSLCLETDKLSVRVKCLLCMSKLLNVIDKWTVQEKLIPCIQMIPSREAPVLMAIIGVFHEMVQTPKLGLDKETVANVIIPYLAPLSIDSGLNARQFKTFMGVLHTLLKYIESQHITKLEQAEALTANASARQKSPEATNHMAETDEKMRALLSGTARPTDMAAILQGASKPQQSHMPQPRPAQNDILLQATHILQTRPAQNDILLQATHKPQPKPAQTVTATATGTPITPSNQRPRPPSNNQLPIHETAVEPIKPMNTATTSPSYQHRPTNAPYGMPAAPTWTSGRPLQPTNTQSARTWAPGQDVAFVGMGTGAPPRPRPPRPMSVNGSAADNYAENMRNQLDALLLGDTGSDSQSRTWSGGLTGGNHQSDSLI